MPRQLKFDDTLEEVVNLLGDPETYLRNVILTMRPAWKIDKLATVRIGTSGVGAYPYHLITWNDADGKLAFNSCDGANVDLNDRIRPDSGDWSTRGITYSKVEELLGEVMARKMKRPK